MISLQEFRRRKDDFFRHSPQSPLTPEQQHDFQGLSYFEEDPALRFELPLERDPSGTLVELITNTGALQRQPRAGTFRFRVEGQEVRLTAYGDPDHDERLFIPFRDATSGEETYGAARYLEPERQGERWVLDFNLAYNPYCAYNDRWRCPFPPPENRLKVPVRAGEKTFRVA